MPRNAHNVNIFNFEFGHEKFTLTFPAPPLKEVPLLRFFSSPPLPHLPFVSLPKFPSPPLKRGGGRIMNILATFSQNTDQILTTFSQNTDQY